MFKTLKGGMTAVLGDKWYLKVRNWMGKLFFSNSQTAGGGERDKTQIRQITHTHTLPHPTPQTTLQKQTQETMPEIEFRAPRPIPADKVPAIKEAVKIDLAAIQRGEHR